MFTGPETLYRSSERERELFQQVGENFVRTIVRGFQAHGIAVAPRGQFALDRAQQVIDFFLLDEQVAVARDAELVAAAHLHAGKQRRYIGFDNRSQENEIAAAEFIGQPDQARQRARRLHHGEAAVASETIFAFHHDREIQALVENFRKWPRGIERQRAQDRFHLAGEIILDPGRLRRRPGFRLDENDAVLRELRHEHIVQELRIARRPGARRSRGWPSIVPAPTIRRGPVERRRLPTAP